MPGVVKIIIDQLKQGTGIKDTVRDLGNLEDVGQKSKFAFTELNSAVTLFTTGLSYAGEAYDATIGKAMDYAQQVRQLSQISGESAEETSRFIQVLDDYQVSAEDVLTATRTLTKEGYAPNLETLAQLSDQYKSLGSQQQKNELIIKTLGRAGLEWSNVLEQGGDALRQMGEEVSKGLILNDEQIRQAEELRLAQDQLNDSWDALAITVGTKAIPVLADYMEIINFNISVTQGWIENMLEGQGVIEALVNAADGMVVTIGDWKFGVGEASKSTENFTDANDNLAFSAEDAAAAIKAEQDAAAALSVTYRGLLGSMSNINKERENFEKTQEKLKKQEQELQAELVREGLAYGEIQRSGEITQQQIDEHIVRVTELQKKLEENRQAEQDLAADTIDASKQRIYQTVEEGLAKDGINQKEFEFLENYKVQQGLIAQADADRAIAERAAAEQIIADYESQNAILDTTQQKLNALVNGSPYNVSINIETFGRIPSMGNTNLSSTGTGLMGMPPGIAAMLGQHAEGGSFIVPGSGDYDRPYMIGLTPGEQVTVTPKGQAGPMNNNFYITGVIDRTMVQYLKQEIERLQTQ